MPYNEAVADRVRRTLARRKGVTEKKMFGGLSFLVNGHMACGVLRDDIVLRLAPEVASEALGDPNVREMDFTGRLMKGLVYLEPAGYASAADLKGWIEKAIKHARSLPPK